MPLKTAYLRYAFPGLPLAALGTPFYIYAPLWFTEHGQYGFTTVALVFLLARGLDALSDLPVGVLVDRIGSPRVLWLSACLLLILSAAALIYLPHPWHPIWLSLCLAALMLAWTMIMVPWLALPVVMSRNDGERLAYNGWREGVLLLGTLIALPAPALLSGQGLQGALLVLMLVLVVSVCLQRPLPSQLAGRAGALRELLGEPRLRALVVPWFVNMLANAIPGTMVLLYMREVLEAERQVPVVLLTYFLAGVLGMPLWYLLARRVGNLTAWRLGLALSAVLFALAIPLGAGDVTWFLAISFGTGLMLGADQAVPAAMQTALVQSLMAERGSENIGARLFAVWSMLSKVALGAAVCLAYLWLGFQMGESNAALPPDWAISAAYIGAPVCLKLVVFKLLAHPQLQRIETAKSLAKTARKEVVNAV